MKNLIGLIDIICDTYDRQDLQPKDGVTYCNIACDAIAQAFGCKYLAGKTADEIFDFFKASEDWSETTMDKVQELANQGSLVFAIANSQMLSQSHGHICVIRPGLEKNSGKWIKCPAVLNVGGENFIGRAKKGVLTMMPVGLNEAFVDVPKFYVYRKSL